MTQEGKANKISYHRYKDFKDLPIRKMISFGDYQVPRVLSIDETKFFPEIFNESIERLADHSNSLEKRFAKIIREEQRKYWANVVGVLGVVISVLALIITGLPKIVTDPTLGFWEIVSVNLAQLLPLALVLTLLVVALRWIVR